MLRYKLQNSGLGDVIGNAGANASLPLVLVAFIVAALVHLRWFPTVAMTMAAGIISAMPGISELSPLYLACVTAAIAGGSTVCSHFNDSGFWLVKSLVGMDEKTTLKTWTIMETLVGGVGFLVALIISFFASAVPACTPDNVGDPYALLVYLLQKHRSRCARSGAVLCPKKHGEIKKTERCRRFRFLWDSSFYPLSVKPR